MTDDEYRITNDDIERMLDLLKLTRPKQATPKIARQILERLYVRQHVLEHIDPDAVEEILQDLEDY
jgi:Holliday junction resolvasome RuvABC ATP-dependent DNA helicase subunit